MSYTVRGVRSIELEMSDVPLAIKFFTEVWNLGESATSDRAAYLRGTSHYHHVLVLHSAQESTSVRRIVFDARDRGSVDGLHARIKPQTQQCADPGDFTNPGGGYGFDFVDPEGRRLAIVCDVDDHSDASDIKDRPRKIAHVNLNAIDVDQTNAFLIENLGFKLIDQSGPLSFLHCDNSDHSSIVVCGTARPTINHIAFELPDLEAVMRGAGRMRDAGYPIEWGPGRHVPATTYSRTSRGPRKFRSNIRLMFCRLTIATCHTAASIGNGLPDAWTNGALPRLTLSAGSASRICSVSEARGYRHQASAASRIKERGRNVQRISSNTHGVRSERRNSSGLLPQAVLSGRSNGQRGT